ncbi:LamG-like jellyroll fold domain-containing protein [Pedobacter glucosidilyticus]|uniref:LamG-like jellyroll fold domain-containing protein n=1 Tax=Pedobacter glucosidilyticus TaxID=1122941 RepID=UPI00040F7E23|nr:LamG-like jellyroll fold domain-containing protein [Pedobacter glucosidilyticus]
MMKKILTIFFALGIMVSNAQVINKAMNFPGNGTTTQQGVSFPNINTLNSVTQFTLEAWVYIDNWNTGSIMLTGNGTATNRIGIQLGTLPNTTKVLYFYVGNGANTSLQVNNPNIDDGAWHHIAMVFDGSQATANDRIKVYIDGIAKTTGIVNNGTFPTSTGVATNPFWLGRDFFKGQIDEVRIWNIALTQSQLDNRNTINAYHPLYNNLLAYWKMDNLTSGLVKDSKGTINGTITATTSALTTVTNNPQFTYKVISGYVRSNFYENAKISNEQILNNNDLIYLTCSPYANGDLFFEYPINDGVLTNANYLSSFNGRNGVMSFGGNGANMNCGKNLLNTATAGANRFSFATWVYVDNWVENSYIFRKQSSASNSIDLQLGAQATSTLYLHIANGGDNYVQLNNSGIADGQWHHVAVTYNGGAGANSQIIIYIDGVSKPLTYKNGNGLLPTSGPFIQSDFELGTNFSGKLDETSVSLLTLSQSEVTSVRNGTYIENNTPSFNKTKVAAYWKYDDAATPGKDSRTWLGVLNALKSTINGYDGIKLRLGVTNGDWTSMITNSTARQNFATNINNIVQTYGLDGVDLDFEWALNSQQWADYSSTIIAVDAALSPTSIFSVSLHPLYHQISTSAIAAVDLVSIQSYGPNPNRFPYSQFLADITTVTNYGFPKPKLLMGVPFYGTASSNPSPSVTTGYNDILIANPSLNPALDEATVNGTAFTFNGKNTIISKTIYTRDQLLGGIMSWDLGNDATLYSNPLSLLRAVNTIANANIGEPDNLFLPVNISSFSVKANLSSVNVLWKTSSEQNSQLFEIERSINGVDFSVLGSVSANGNSSKIISYQFDDLSPVTGIAYYRLKQIDQDGKFEYSDVKSVHYYHGKKVSINIYPNPAKDKLIISGPSTDIKEVVFSDLTGRELWRKANPETSLIIPENISPGIYILTVIYKDAVYQQKVVMQN